MLLVFLGINQNLYKQDSYKLLLSNIHHRNCVLLYKCIVPQVSCLTLLRIFSLSIKKQNFVRGISIYFYFIECFVFVCIYLRVLVQIVLCEIVLQLCVCMSSVYSILETLSCTCHKNNLEDFLLSPCSETLNSLHFVYSLKICQKSVKTVWPRAFSWWQLQVTFLTYFLKCDLFSFTIYLQLLLLNYICIFCLIA